MHIDSGSVPFSRYGSYLVVSTLHASQTRQAGVYLRSVRGGDDSLGELLRIELVDENGTCQHAKAIGQPSKLIVRAAEGEASICFFDPHTVRIRTQGVGIRLHMMTGAYDYAYQTESGAVKVNSFLQHIRLHLASLRGRMTLDAPWDGKKSRSITICLLPEEVVAEVAITEYHTVLKPVPATYTESFDECVKRVDEEFRRWLAQTLPVPTEYERGRQLAAYITWSCVVAPSGQITRPAMYMSKNWMTNIWSWDNCFNAMALVQHNPELACDQLLIFFDRQDESGMIPDFLNDRYALWNCTKPPIHGWALGWMMRRSSFFTPERLVDLYEPLSRWTNWWMEHRMNGKDGVPYYEHGNDSGWDNSTVFAHGIPVASPDLLAYLVVQMDVLAAIAEKLGRSLHSEELGKQSASWRMRADHLLQVLLDRFWNEDRFLARHAISGEPIESESLLLLVPLVLGPRLPVEIFSKMVAGLKRSDRFLTPNELATESVSSESYQASGYWRGPIWAPATLLIVDGLLQGGEAELARTIAIRFCNMAQAAGMAENFNAMTGEALCDPAFTWTSSVYLILAHELCR